MRTLSITALLLAVSVGVGAQQPTSGSVVGGVFASDEQPLAGTRVEAVSGSRTVAQ